MKKRKSLESFWLLVFSLNVLLGCGPSREATYPVQGVVHFSDGKPVPFGTVELRSKDSGRIARGTLDANGRFAVGTFDVSDGAVAGEHQAIVVQLSAPDSVAQRKEVELVDPEAHAAHGAVQLLSPRYAQYSTSPLTVTVTPDSETNVEWTVDPLPRKRSR